LAANWPKAIGSAFYEGYVLKWITLVILKIYLLVMVIFLVNFLNRFPGLVYTTLDPLWLVWAESPECSRFALLALLLVHAGTTLLGALIRVEGHTHATFDGGRLLRTMIVNEVSAGTAVVCWEHCLEFSQTQHSLHKITKVWIYLRLGTELLV
jgi:hypothetical protein